jgi:thymidylate kinase
MTTPQKFLVEGIDRVGKDHLISKLLDLLGYYHVIHYEKPKELNFYSRVPDANALKAYQEDSFRTMFSILRDTSAARVACNRAHLGEYVYAPMYRQYSGKYVFDLEREFAVDKLLATRLILLTEDFERSTHFIDDGRSLGGTDQRKAEQELFLEAFTLSIIADKRVISITDPSSGAFRQPDAIVQEALT